MDVEHGVIRHAMALIRLNNGINAQLTASYVTEEKVRTIQIVTKNAFIQADLLNKTVVMSHTTNFTRKNAVANYTQQSVVERVVVPSDEPLRLQLMDFMDSVLQGREPRVSGQDGLSTIQLTHNIRRVILNDLKRSLVN